MNIEINVGDIIGRDYDEFWTFRKRYRVVKGGRGSKKSTTTALWIVISMMMNKLANTLVVRRFFNTHRNSTFAQIQWAIDRVGVHDLWKSTTSPLEFTFKPTGQKILFRGLDDPQSITSIVSSTGYICWCWWEEAFQITDENAFNKVDMSLRGKMPEDLFIQHTLTLNPWSDRHWIKKRFFDKADSSILAITRNYTSNEWLSDADIELFEKMRTDQPKRYAIEGRGEWGISEGLIFEQWEVKDFSADAMLRMVKPNRLPMQPRYRKLFGMDFGFSNDPTAFVCLLVDEDKRELYVCSEFYKTGMVIDDIYRAVVELGCQNETIIADSAMPLMIEELRRKGLHGIRPAKKGPNSIMDGIARLQDFRIFIHPSCQNAETEFSNYCWKTDNKTGLQTGTPIDEFNHLIDAMRYATEGIARATFRWANT